MCWQASGLRQQSLPNHRNSYPNGYNFIENALARIEAVSAFSSRFNPFRVATMLREPRVGLYRPTLGYTITTLSGLLS
jgi:hypothetical protein